MDDEPLIEYKPQPFCADCGCEIDMGCNGYIAINPDETLCDRCWDTMVET